MEKLFSKNATNEKHFKMFFQSLQNYYVNISSLCIQRSRDVILLYRKVLEIKFVSQKASLERKIKNKFYEN